MPIKKTCVAVELPSNSTGKGRTSVLAPVKRRLARVVEPDPVAPSVECDQAPASKPVKPYWLYLLECRGGSWYAGIALDVQERFKKHIQGKGAAYTRANPPLRVLASMVLPCKGDALRAEYAVKQLPKCRKLAFFGAT